MKDKESYLSQYDGGDYARMEEFFVLFDSKRSKIMMDTTSDFTLHLLSKCQMN